MWFIEFLNSNIPALDLSHALNSQMKLFVFKQDVTLCLHANVIRKILQLLIKILFPLMPENHPFYTDTLSRCKNLRCYI